MSQCCSGDDGFPWNTRLRRPSDDLTVLIAEEVGLPTFDVNPTETADVCHRLSHERAREATEFGLSIDNPGYMSSLSVKTEVAGYSDNVFSSAALR